MIERKYKLNDYEGSSSEQFSSIVWNSLFINKKKEKRKRKSTVWNSFGLLGRHFYLE